MKEYKLSELPPANRRKPNRPRNRWGKWYSEQEKFIYDTDPILHTRWPDKMDDLEHTLERLPALDPYKIPGLMESKGKYSPEQKVLAATLVALTGSPHAAARRTGIPISIISSWKRAPWWQDIIYEVKKYKSEEFDAKATAIIDSLLDEIDDRIKNGDEVVLRDGSKVRKKTSMRDNAVVTSILFDKRALGRGDPTSRVHRVDNNKLLKDLKKSFEGIVKEKDVKGDRIVDEQ